MDLRIDRGTLLAAAPELLDPNFMHAVVLIVQHDENGAYGLVVNKPTELTIDQLLPEHPRFQKLSFPVHWGGPVGLDHLQVLHSAPEEIPGGLKLGGGLYLGGDLEAVARLLEKDPQAAAQRVRFLLGYSGWGEGQLDRELVSESWLPARLRSEFVFSSAQEPTWREVVRTVGGQAEGFESLPPDATWN
jgi:putative transcriptional regulator